MRQYEMFELSFSGPAPENEVAVPLEAAFTQAGTTTVVSGFYAGNGQYKVRFLPAAPGKWSWSVKTPLALEGPLTGTADCAAAEGAHGMVRAAGTHFRYEDGTPYLPFGTTIYALVHQEPERVDQTMDTLRHAPFNKVRMCVFPKHYDFNHNEPPLFAFCKTGDKFDTSRPCYAFWDMLEARLAQMDGMGIQADLILFHPYDHWGFAKLTEPERFAYLDYLTRRLAAFPNVWWSLANEYDLMLNDISMEEWYGIEGFVAGHDPYHHLLSNHNCVKFYDFSRSAVTHVCLQNAMLEKAAQYAAQYGKPVLYDEMCYEGNLSFNWGNISGFEMVNRFWQVCAGGAYGTHGETFLAEDDVIWWAKGGVLKGESPARIAWMRQIFESLPGPLTGEAPRSIPNELLDDPKKLEAAMAGAPQEALLFIRILTLITPMERENFLTKQAAFKGHCGQEAFLQYFARTCPGIATMRLPEGKQYRVEVLDVWEMTRTTAAEGVSGSVTVKLPGKEGIAVLATAL